MAGEFTNFVLELAQNPKTLAEFQKEPNKTASSAGLTPTEIEVLKSNDSGLIRTAIAADSDAADPALRAGFPNIRVVIYTYVRRPQ